MKFDPEKRYPVQLILSWLHLSLWSGLVGLLGLRFFLARLESSATLLAILAWAALLAARPPPRPPLQNYNSKTTPKKQKKRIVAY